MIRAWVTLHFAGVPHAFSQVIGMKLRGTLSRELVSALVICEKLDLGISATTLEAHALAGGRVHDIAVAAAHLDRAGEPVPVELLCTIDLERGDVPDLAEAFVQLRETFPELGLAEVAKRYSSGEDVITAARQGTFEPVANQSGWAIRIEYGPLSGEAVRELADKAATAARVTVRRPGSRKWRPISQVKELAGG